MSPAIALAEAEATPRTQPQLSPLCPSARPDMDESRVFGIVDGPHEQRQVAYLERPLPVTPEVVALAGQAEPMEVFRFAAPCAGSACRHFDGHDCSLASRIVELLPMVVRAVPPCAIRPECRWWRQEGAKACLRCPQITSLERQPSEALRVAADPGSARSPR